jgi:hypothetical protein
MNKDLIQKALSVATGGNLTGYLPDTVVADVIGYARETNILRRLLGSFKMNRRSITRPKKLGALSAYHVPDGTTATLSQYNTGTVTWEAKKLMAFTAMEAEVEEDSVVDAVNDILIDFGDAIGEAEELAFMAGDPSHLATAPTPGSATEQNWYQYDPRLICEGIFKVALSVDAATSVNANSAVFGLDMVNKAIYNLGKYGRNRQRLIGLMPSIHAMQARQNDKFKDASVSGQALASFITGLGSAGEGQGIVSVIYNVPFFEAPQAAGGTIAILDKRTPLIGDRRMIKVKTAEVIETDMEKYVISERVALNYNFRDAMVAIKEISVADEESSS